MQRIIIMAARFGFYLGEYMGQGKYFALFLISSLLGVRSGGAAFAQRTCASVAVNSSAKAHSVPFKGKVVFLGYGGVAQAVMPLLFKHLQPAFSNVRVIDFTDARKKLQPWMNMGVNFSQEKISPDNYTDILSSYLSAGDILIDLAWNIDTRALLTWCRLHGVMYINTSTELWDPYKDADKQHPTERTLYKRHMDLRKLISQWNKPGATAVLEHGANPGLISHFLKKGLLDIAEACLANHKLPVCKIKPVQEAMATSSFGLLAQSLGIKVVHCSEIDTQISSRPHYDGEFQNTWSVEGFREEGTTTAEMGWGTHEKELPQGAFEHSSGPKNQICLARAGMNVLVRSVVPSPQGNGVPREICGMVVRHGEAFTLSDYLTVHGANGKPIYRPTVHYAYCPSPAAIASLNRLRGNGYELQPHHHILGDDIVTGSDILGALIMGDHPYQAWWTGSDLSIEQTRAVVDHQNATTLQVAAAIMGALEWMLKNPERGVVLPEDLPHEDILRTALPYLGNLRSEPLNFNPLMNRVNLFPGYHKPDLDLSDPWQWKNFVYQEGD